MSFAQGLALDIAQSSSNPHDPSEIGRLHSAMGWMRERELNPYLGFADRPITALASRDMLRHDW